MVNSFLERIVAHKRRELDEARARTPISALEERLASAPDPRDVVGRLDSRRLGVIAEIKRASPSKGAIALDLDAAAQARRYEAGGADAISVLTDREFYHGSPDDLRAVRAAVSTPVLYKDFVLERYALLQARLAGADLVLLIVAALGAEGLLALVGEARALGMTPLVEVYKRDEAVIALECGAELIGVNNRNLHTFEVTLETTERLAPLLASRATVVSLSGIYSAADAERVAAAGARAVLVGEALVRASDPAALIRELRGVPLAPDPRRAPGERESARPSAPAVKICGVRSVAQARAAADAGAEMVGLIFAESRRRVTPDEAREITGAAYARRPRFVGVFVNEEPDTVGRLAAAARLDLVQLSGVEAPEQCARLRVPYTKVVHVRPDMTPDDIVHVASLYPHATALVLDAAVATPQTWGGTGTPINWSVAASAVRRLDRPVLLAGGLRPETVGEAVRAVRPWGVDVSSGVETDGVKDEEKIRAFVAAARAALEVTV